MAANYDADPYHFKQHADAELMDLYRAGKVRRAIITEGVLKVYAPVNAYYFEGVRMTKGKQGRGYITSAGDEYHTLEDAKAALAK